MTTVVVTATVVAAANDRSGSPPLRSCMEHTINTPDPDIIRIQERIAYLEQTVTELSSVLYEQHSKLARISRTMDMLTAKVKSM